MDVAEQFRTQFTKLCHTRGLQQKQLALKAGIHEATVSFYKTGRMLPNIKNLVALANALNVSTDELLGLASRHTTPVVTLFGQLTEHDQGTVTELMRGMVRSAGEQR